MPQRVELINLQTFVEARVLINRVCPNRNRSAVTRGLICRLFCPQLVAQQSAIPIWTQPKKIRPQEQCPTRNEPKEMRCGRPGLSIAIAIAIAIEGKRV